MTKKEAIEILIESSIRDITGSGKGMRNTTDEWRQKVRTAVKIMWKHIHKREITESEAFNIKL